MSRPTVHAPDALLDAARAVLIRAGVENTTIQAIAEESGAPVGSLYNRFRSRRELFAQLWLRAAQRSQAAGLPALGHQDPLEAAVRCALAQVEFTRREHADARLLASFRREDLLGDARSPELVKALEELNRPIESAIRELSRRMYGDTRAEHRRKLAFATLDLPLAAVRRYLLADKPVPAEVAVWLERAVRAVLAEP